MTTPGAALTTDAATVCVKGYARTVRNTLGKLKTDRKYIDRKDERLEVDGLINLELGGVDTPAHLWLESSNSSRWGAHLKDRLLALCAGKILRGALTDSGERA
jgi:hypothetical protein